MTGFYTDVENLDSLEARRSALVGFESLMADATGTMDAKGLGIYLNLDLPETFNAEYPKLEIKGSKVGSAVQITEATPEQIASDQQLRAAKTLQAAATAQDDAQQKLQSADDRIIARGKKATEVAEAEAKLQETAAGLKAEKKAVAEADSVKRGKSLYANTNGRHGYTILYCQSRCKCWCRCKLFSRRNIPSNSCRCCHCYI